MLKFTGKLEDLIPYGFKHNGNDVWPAMEIELKEYPEYENDNGLQSISVRKDNSIWVEIPNNDCTYHTEGNELNPVIDKLYDLIKAGLLIKEEEKNHE